MTPVRLYQMFVNGEERFMKLREAGVMYDNGWADVRIGGKVIEPDGLVRDITDEERVKIRDIADQWSASK